MPSALIKEAAKKLKQRWWMPSAAVVHCRPHFHSSATGSSRKA